MMNASLHNVCAVALSDVPDREAQFRLGWVEASFKDYPAGMLREPTWRNLGYRLGKLYGQATDETISMQYDWCLRGGIANLVRE